MPWWRAPVGVGRRAAAQVARLPAPAVLAIGFAGFVVYSFPGMMTLDSYDQLAQARAHFYRDDHPPAMAVLWGLVDRVWSGPAPMLLAQGAALLAGVWLILRRAMSSRPAAWLAGALVLCPPILTTMAVIWKDCQMAGFLALGAGLLFDERRWARAIGLVLVGYATAVRYNAPAATLPIVVLILARPGAGAPAGWRAALRRHAIAAGVWAVVTVVATTGNALATDRKMYFWYSSLAPMDIVGTLKYAPGTLSDERLRHELRGTPLVIHDDIHAAARRLYQPWNFFQLVEGPNRMFDTPMDRVVPAAERDAIARAWWSIVSTYPGAYLYHRLRTFREVVGVTPMDRPPWGAVTVRRDLVRTADDFGGVQDGWQRRLAWLGRHTWIYRPWLYALLSLGLLYPCRRQRAALALLASGLLNEACLFFIAPTPDYRYSHWSVACSLVALVLCLARVIQRRREPAPG